MPGGPATAVAPTLLVRGGHLATLDLPPHVERHNRLAQRMLAGA